MGCITTLNVNINKDENSNIIDYPIFLLRCKVSCGICNHINWSVLPQPQQCDECSFSINQVYASGSVSLSTCGVGRIIVPLRVGVNLVVVHCCHSKIQIYLTRQVSLRNHYVRLLYVVFANDEHHGRFQMPDGSRSGSLSCALAKLGLAGQLLQCACADLMHRATDERITFELHPDMYLANERKCIQPIEEEADSAHAQVFYSQITHFEAISLSNNELWLSLAKELAKQWPADLGCTKWLAWLSCTEFVMPAHSVPRTYSQILAHTRGFVALGAGGLALLGSAALHAWPSKISEASSAFRDATRMDQRKVMDESAGRDAQRWALVATSLGAALHELGHTFDLGHTRSGIMARGCDDLNLVFAAPPAVSAHNLCLRCPLVETHFRQHTRSIAIVNEMGDATGDVLCVSDCGWPSRSRRSQACQHSGEAEFSESCALLLRHHVWLNNRTERRPVHRIYLSRKPRPELVAEAGLAVAELRLVRPTMCLDNLVVHHWRFPTPRTGSLLDVHRILLSTTLLRRLLPPLTRFVMLVAMDRLGTLFKTQIDLNHWDDDLT